MMPARNSLHKVVSVEGEDKVSAYGNQTFAVMTEWIAPQYLLVIEHL